MKRIIITALFAIFSISNMQAGKTRGKVTTARPTPKMVIGGGTSKPSNATKDKAFLSNTTAISIDASIPITKRGWGPNGNWFGVNIGCTYNSGGKGGFGTTQNPYAITGQTSSMVDDRGGDPIQAGFRMGAGPQANFNFGKFMVSPMVLGEYFSMTRKERSSVQTTQYNGQSYDFKLATLPQTKTSGFAVTPKLRLQYMFNNRFGLFADASYTLGPKVETQITKLIPNGAANQQGTYEIQALQNASYVKGETKTTSYNATGFNFGVVINLGKPIKPTCTCCGSLKHSTGECTKCVTNSTSSSSVIHTKDLTDDIPKYCACCFQEGHDADVCIIPCKARVKGNSSNEIRKWYDPIKGWNGKIVDLFGTDNIPSNGTKFVTIDAKGELTQEKKIEFENGVKSKIPQAQNIQSQIRRSDNIPYVETQFNYKGKDILF